MRTIHWYDLRWSTDKLRVNDKMTITGKFHVFKGWPETANNPESSPAFLNIGIPGPVFTRQESYIGGQFVPRSVNLTLGEDYSFKVVLQARRPGRWHVHTMMNVEGAGPIIGPGKWVQIEGRMADYKSEVQTLTGRTEDIERVGTAGIVGWSAFWFLFGCAWIGYWAAKPLFLPRYMAVKDGVPDEELVSPMDVKVGIGFMIAAIAITALSYWSANAAYPVTIPLQAGVIGTMEPDKKGPRVVEVTSEQATYRVAGRSISMEVRVSNRGPNPVQVAEFQTAGIRFLNPSVYKDDTNYPPQLLAPEGLSVDDNSPILPGHTKVLTVTGTDAAWQNERLGEVIYDPDSRYGGLLVLIDNDGRPHVEPIGGPLLPCFDDMCEEIGRARREAAERAAVAVPAAPAAEWFWNAWAEAPPDKNPRTPPSFRPVAYLEPEQKYRVTVDLAGLPYRIAGSARLEQPVGEEIRKQLQQGIDDRSRTRLSFVPIVITGSPQIETPSKVLPEFTVDLEKMRAFGKRDPREDPADPLAHLTTGGGSADFLFGRIEPFEIRTAATTGETVIGIALWSVEAARPIEELSIPLCIAEKEDECKQRAGVISLRSGGVVDLPADGEVLPDAAMHIIGLDPEHVAGIFAENKDGRLNSLSDYNVWRVAGNAMDFLQEIDNQQQSFGEARDDPIAVGDALMKLLFPENENKPNYKGEDNAARRARAKFEAFLKSSRASEPFGSVPHNVLFVRMIGQGFPEPALYPVGLLAPDDDEQHLAGFHLRVELPLPRQSYATFKDHECIRRWKLLLPLERSDDRALTDAYDRLHHRFRSDMRGSGYQIVNAKLPVFSSMKEFRGWIGARESGDGTAPSREPPLLLAIVSHHDKDKIYFNRESPVSHANVSLHFKAPTMAILSNCSSATIGASGFVKALNSQGVDTVIATNTGIGGDLAGDFVECISTVVETQAADEPIEAGDLFTAAQHCLYEKEKGNEASILSFSLAGNPHLKLCAPE